MDGKPVMSCMVLAVEAEGKAIETVENLAWDGNLHPVQQAFIDHDAVQCGFCTPGIIMSAKALLDANPNPTEDEIKEALAGNLCRCGCYRNIIAAVLEAAG
jgi:aerobic-type carbon monoxide dehydrogenase small subunit (CoxS/CutS family)